MPGLSPEVIQGIRLLEVGQGGQQVPLGILGKAVWVSSDPSEVRLGT